MILQRSFLEQALPSATIVIGGTWKRIEEGDHFNGQDGECAVAIDSRALQPGELFAALSGDRCDGHDFIGLALEKGASGIIINHNRFEAIKEQWASALTNHLIICVDDVKEALVALARAWRALFTCPIVGVTGSIGKTTTKEIIRSIFIAGRIKGFVSHKNENNPLGLCINILRMSLKHEVGVFEVATAQPGRINLLASLLRPTIALITGIAHSHGKDIGSLHDIAYEKRQIFSHFQQHDVGIIFGDQPLLHDVHYQHPVAKFGFKTKNQVQARKVRYGIDELGRPVTHFLMKWYHERAQIMLNGVHAGRVVNALAASTIAYFLKIPFEAVLEGITSYQGVEQRFEERRIKVVDGRIISDCYNANPESMKAALKAFDQMSESKTKIAVLGDMLELGDKELYWHRQVGRFLNKIGTLTTLILVGKRARVIAQTAPKDMMIHYADDWQHAVKTLSEMLPVMSNPLVLVKGSRDMKLDRVVDHFV